ncbi:hypothetical protein EX30DRAFT_343232 [Ascodesmis nigricans]|uniref:Uncharacterized protein n=1 Tax=Ascodesmis nigricans TaxID=341454 RepID=A0A4S2MMI9_9PEZI|nr:hypothetical protein EX30DRAFT_343232 [Ascodesmis nigricans]
MSQNVLFNSNDVSSRIFDRTRANVPDESDMSAVSFGDPSTLTPPPYQPNPPTAPLPPPSRPTQRPQPSHLPVPLNRSQQAIAQRHKENINPTRFPEVMAMIYRSETTPFNPSPPPPFPARLPRVLGSELSALGSTGRGGTADPMPTIPRVLPPPPVRNYAGGVRGESELQRRMVELRAGAEIERLRAERRWFLDEPRYASAITALSERELLVMNSRVAERRVGRAVGSGWYDEEIGQLR